MEEEKKGDSFKITTSEGEPLNMFGDEEKKKNKKKKNKKKKEEEEPIDDMDFLRSIIADKYTCPVKGCEASIKLGWCMCKNCKGRFCPLHFHPEKHDCKERPKDRVQYTESGPA